MHLEEKTLSSEQKFDGKIVKLYVDSVELEDGKKSFREVIKTPGECVCCRWTRREMCCL